MIRARIEALVRELRTPDGRSRTHIGHAAARVEIADRLTQILAEEEGGWRPIAEMPAWTPCEIKGGFDPLHYCPCHLVGKLTHFRYPEPPPGPRP